MNHNSSEHKKSSIYKKKLNENKSEFKNQFSVQTYIINLDESSNFGLITKNRIKKKLKKLNAFVHG